MLLVLLVGIGEKMSLLATTKMSSKGQIVIPENIRESLNLHQGTEFVVLSNDDAIVLKPIFPPSVDEFASLLKKARAEAKSAGLKKSDLKKAIRDVRKNK